MFKKKEKTLADRHQAITQKLDSLKGEIAKRQAGVNEAKTILAQRLGNLALEESGQNRESVKHSKKAVGRSQESLEDLTIMVRMLEDELVNLNKQRLEATVRESPDKLKDLAREFNKTLGKALSKLQELKTLHTDLSNYQTAFYGLLRERQLAVSSLGIMAPLNLEEGLGELAGDNTPTPFRSTAQIPDNESAFLNSLIGYRDQLANWESYQKANPNWKEREIALAEAPRQVGGIGAVGDPDRDKSYRQVYEPGQPSQQ